MSLAFGPVALSIQRALIGEILPQFRAICLSIADDAVTVTISHDGALPQGTAEDLDSALTQVYADFPELGGSNLTLHLGFERHDTPSAIPIVGTPIFARKGTQFLVPAD